MMTKTPRKKPVRKNYDQVIEMLEALPRIRVTPDGGDYTSEDRARDFLAVFGGTSTREQGQRVLSQISQICDPVTSITDADKHGTLAMKAGMRRVMHEIMLCMVAQQRVVIESTPQGQ